MCPPILPWEKSWHITAMSTAASYLRQDPGKTKANGNTCGKSDGKSRGKRHGKSLGKSRGRPRCNTRGEIEPATLFPCGHLYLPRVLPRDLPRRVLPTSVLHVFPRAWHVRLAWGPAVAFRGH